MLFSPLKSRIFLLLVYFFCFNLLFAQTGNNSQSSIIQNHGRYLLEYQFERADRESSPLGWMEEARRGLSHIQAVWAEMFPDLFNDPLALNDLIQWSENELEKRFTLWLLDRFFGYRIEQNFAGVFLETGEAGRMLIFHTGEDGLFLYDENSGDPKVIRPGDEGHDFYSDLALWRDMTYGRAENEINSINYGIRELYPELLNYFDSEQREEIEMYISLAIEGTVGSIRTEFEAVLAREERYFTAQRLGDIYSFRRRSESQSAEAIALLLIEEARLASAESIASIEAKIEAARGDERNIDISGADWLDEFMVQFYRGIQAWEQAEEQFLIRRLEWEESTERTFHENMNSWLAILSRFDEERRNWEEQARILFMEGESLFMEASEKLNAAIMAARAEFEEDRRFRASAASGRAGALTSILLLNSTAAKEAGNNLIFWINEYRVYNPMASIPEEEEALFIWIENELAGINQFTRAHETFMLNEINTWFSLYQNYTTRTEESRINLLKELYSVTGSFDLFGNDLDLLPGYFEAELIRAEAELDYWRHREAVSEAVAAYALTQDAARVTASESIRAFEAAKAAHENALSLYLDAEERLRAENILVFSAMEELNALSMQMMAADEILENLKQSYYLVASSFGTQENSGFLAGYDQLGRELSIIRDHLDRMDDSSLWGEFLLSSRELGLVLAEELRKNTIAYLISGDGENNLSLEELALRDDVFSVNEMQIRLASISFLMENESGWDWYFSVHDMDRDSMSSGQALETRLLLDWEFAHMDFLSVKLDLLYRDYNILDPDFYERISEQFQSYGEMMKEENYSGGLQLFLIELAKDPEFEFFLFMDNIPLINDLLTQYKLKEEFAEGLIQIYLEYSIISPFVIKERIDNGINQLGFIWDLTGHAGFSENAFLFPRTELLALTIENMDGDNFVNAFILINALDEIMESFPMWFDFSYSLWKNNFLDFIMTSSQDSLLLAERHRNIINLSLMQIFQDEPGILGFEIMADIDQYIENYDRRINDLIHFYSLESNISDEINRLIPVITVMEQGREVMEEELNTITERIRAAEEEYSILALSYRNSADNFMLAVDKYDMLYEQSETAFRNLEEARRAFEIQEAVRMWAETAYLDSAHPIDELNYHRNRALRAQNAYDFLLSFNPDTAPSLSYLSALENFEEGMSLYSLALEAAYAIEAGLLNEINRNAVSYRLFWESMNLFGRPPQEMDINYISPEDMAMWDIHDFIDVDENGRLFFARLDNNELTARDEQRSERLFDYFNNTVIMENENLSFTAFELSLIEFAETLNSMITTPNDYINFGLARDYLIRNLINSNPDIEELASYYKTADNVLGSGTNLGSRRITNFIRVYQTYGDVTRNDLPQMQMNAWNALNEEKKEALEFFTILELMGGGGRNGNYFSLASAYSVYRMVYDEAYIRTLDAYKVCWIPFFGLFLIGEYHVIKATRDEIWVPYSEHITRMNLGYAGLNETTNSISNNLETYLESSENLLVFRNTGAEALSWENAERAFFLSGFNHDDIQDLKQFYDVIVVNDSAFNGFNLGFNLVMLMKMLAEEAGFLMEDAANNLNREFAIIENEREGQIASYREIYSLYLSGDCSLEDLMAQAEIGFSGLSQNRHLENFYNVISDNLYRLNNSGLGAALEYQKLALMFPEIINRAWDEKYDLELSKREEQWALQFRDLDHQYRLWLNSAEKILERGRFAWRDNEEMLNDAFNAWLNSFESEYSRISDLWTASYLEGLHNKEVWASYALNAASEASSEVMLALVGSSAEAGARTFDTLDPMGIMLNTGAMEGERIISEILGSIGNDYLYTAFNSIRRSGNSLTAAVRNGLNPGAVRNYGTALVMTASLSKTVREEFEERELSKLTHIVMSHARNAYLHLEDNVRTANENYRQNMDEIFIIEGQWGRSGSGYRKNVVVHSTFFFSNITDLAVVEGYMNFILPETSLSEYFNQGLPQNIDLYQKELLIDSINSSFLKYVDEIFNNNNGLFTLHIGEGPLKRSNYSLDNGKEGLFENQGSGEQGRLLAEYIYWNHIESRGIMLMNAAPWDKPLWDSRGSFFSAPSLRSAASLAIKIAGGGLIGSIVGDLVFSGLDIAGGYKSWEEAGFSMGKSLAGIAANNLVGGVFSGMSGLYSKEGITGVGYNAILAGSQAFTGNITSGIINGLNYTRDGGFSYSFDAFSNFKQGGINALSSGLGNFTTGIMSLGAMGFTNSHNNIHSNAIELSKLTGNLVSQSINFASGNDFVFNLFNINSISEKYNSGLVELHIGRNGIGMQMGDRGYELNRGVITNSFLGLEAWKANAQIFFGNNSSRTYASQMRTLYSGNDVLKQEYNNVLEGRTVFSVWDEDHMYSHYDEETGIKTIFINRDALNSSSPLDLNVYISHEAYRDGIKSGEQEQKAETERAVIGHAETAMNIFTTYGGYGQSAGMVIEAILVSIAQNTSDSRLMDTLTGRYDSSDDYWKIMPDGTLVTSKDGWLKLSDGTYVRDANGNRIGAEEIETGLLNILYGGTHNVRYSNYSDEQIAAVQTLMRNADMTYSNDENDNPRTRRWEGNPENIPLDMNDVMESFGTTVASHVFARYYNNNIVSSIAASLDMDLSFLVTRSIPESVNARLAELYFANFGFFNDIGGFVDHSLDYYYTLSFKEWYNDNYEFYKYLHFGLDLSREGGSEGDSIFAGIPGRVSNLDWNYRDNGFSMEIEYGFMFEGVFIGTGIFGQYLHLLNEPELAVGTIVDSMTIIGNIGGSPYNEVGKEKYRPHLHYTMLTKNINFNLAALVFFLGHDGLNSLSSINGVNTTYDPLTFYNHFLGIYIPRWDE